MNDLMKIKIQVEAIKEIIIETITDENRMFVEGQLYGLDVVKNLVEKMERENES